MWRPEPRADSGSPGCPDLLQHVQASHSPSSPLYLSFFEEECRAIVARLRFGAAAEPSPIPGELRARQPEPGGAATSTPLHGPSHGRLPDWSGGDGGAAAAPGPAPREPGCLQQPAAGGGPGARPAPGGALPPAQPRRARRGPAQPPGSPARSPGRARLALPRARGSLGLRGPAAGTGRGAGETRLLRAPGKRGHGGEPRHGHRPALRKPLSPPGTRLKLTSPARSRLQRASGASQQAQPPRRPKPGPRDREMKSNSAPAGWLTRSREACGLHGRREKGSGCSLAEDGAWGVGVDSSGTGSTTQQLVCNRTRELQENGESKERLIAGGTVLEAGKNDQTWVCVESSLSRELAPGLNSGCKDAVPAEQSAGDQLFQELKCVKKELERVKAELADKTAQCEAYQQTISSLQAQLRAAGICLKDAEGFNSGDLGRN